MAEANDRRIQALESAVAALTQQLVAVQEQLAATRVGGFRSMRDSRRCPACGSDALLHIRRAKEAGDSNALTDFSLAHTHTFWGTLQHKGVLETFTCRHCSIVEWHVLDVAEIPVDGTNIVAIEPEGEPPAAGPFR